MKEFKVGQTYRVRLDGYLDTRKIHIMHIIPSFYEHEKLIIFRFYGKHYKWWHQDMITDEDLNIRIQLTNKQDDNN